MKLSLKHLLLISAIALASQSSLARAEEGVAVASDADIAAEVVVEEAIEAAIDNDNDAGKECAADDCANPSVLGEEPVVDAATTSEEEGEDAKCPSRPHVIRCAAKHLDTNQNGALERDELENAMKNVSWIVRGLLKVIGSVDSIMKKCDADGDGQITIEHDMEATKETCLATCFKRKAFKRLFFPDCTE
ncbi:hypothetical protein ACHAWU_003614 [Discostella pseudostelligera]|uniref:EF-hand domain-containing protein n=1 Tax=Discostella pseudostelligera TaxID=259834 RepID=A0ABD3MD28_9STRA